MSTVTGPEELERAAREYSVFGRVSPPAEEAAGSGA